MNTAELVANCPRCGATRITFDVKGSFPTRRGPRPVYETFCICRACEQSTVYTLVDSDPRNTQIGKAPTQYPGVINRFFDVVGYISTRDVVQVRPPKHLPDNINACFKEGAVCITSKCPNAAATMFRLCIELAIQSLIDEHADSVVRKRSLAHRLSFLFDEEHLSSDLQELANCIREDGNAGAHDGTLAMADAQDLLDFTVELLNRVYTKPEEIRLKLKRREQRRRNS